MKLRDLDGTFIKRHEVETGTYHVRCSTLAEADGVEFLCPKCFVENGGRVGTHAVICWFVGRVPDTAVPGPGRWTPHGTGLDDLTFVPPPDQVSVHLTQSPCGWHGHVKGGRSHADMTGRPIARQRSNAPNRRIFWLVWCRWHRAILMGPLFR